MNVQLLKRDDKQPVWQRFRLEHGVYAITFHLHELNTWGEEQSLSIDNFVAYLPSSTWLKALTLGNIQYHNKEIRMIGRFKKNGSKISFVALEEQF